MLCPGRDAAAIDSSELELREPVSLDDLDLARETPLAMAAQQALRPCRVAFAQGRDDLPVLLHGLRGLRMRLQPERKHPCAMSLVPAVRDDLAQAAVTGKLHDLE